MKAWYESKTIRKDILLIVIAVAFFAADFFAQQTALTLPAACMFVGGVGGIVLRVLYTDQPIATPQARAKHRAKLDAQIETRQDEHLGLY